VNSFVKLKFVDSSKNEKCVTDLDSISNLKERDGCQYAIIHEYSGEGLILFM